MSFPLGTAPLDIPAACAALQMALEAELAQAPAARLCVLVKALSGDVLFEHQAAQSMPSASLIKVPILLLLLEQAAQGHRTLNDVLPVPAARVGGTGILHALPSVQAMSLRDLAHLMITLSDNVATNLLIDALGMEVINAWCVGNGLAHTRIERRMMDAEARARGLDNWTTAQDACAVLEQLLPGRTRLPPELSRLGLEMLAEQHSRDAFPAQLPPDACLAHKTGALSGLRHDAGILTLNGHSVVLAVLADGFQDAGTRQSFYGGDGARTLARLAAATARALAQSGR